jgi:glycosyltransferase involved in cell wall biosynthesis
MNTGPKISVITPAYNSGRFLEECLQSVRDQNYQNIEHVVMDSLSKDNTLEILKKYEGTYGLVYVSEKDGGIADAMNKGFRKATGDIFAWVDADNYYAPGIINEVAELFEKNPDIDIVYGNIEIFGENGYRRTYGPPPELTFKKSLVLTTGAIPAQPAVFFRRKLFEQVNGFNTSYRVAGDYDFWVKVLKMRPKLLYVNKIFGYYRKEDSAASQSAKGIYKGFREVDSIARVNGQPFYGRVCLALKYGKGIFRNRLKSWFNI